MLTSSDMNMARAVLKESLDNVIFSEWGKSVRLVYSQITTDCPNCIEVGPFNSINQYKPGGPIPFTVGKCPYCGGVGTVSNRPYKDTVARIRRIKKNEYREQLQIENPEGIIVIKGKMIDFEDFRRADYLILEPSFKPEQKYIRLAEPQDHNSIVQNLYFNMLWQQA